MNWRDNAIVDSSYIRNGSFSLKGRLYNPENLLLHGTDSITKEFIYTNLLIGNENVTINANKGDFTWNIDASGSESQDIAEKFNQIEYQRQELNKHLRENFEKLQVENKDEERLNNKLKNVSDSLDKIKIELIKENFNSYAALINFKYYKNHFSSTELAGLYENLSPELKQSIHGKAIKTQIEYPTKKLEIHSGLSTSINSRTSGGPYVPYLIAFMLHSFLLGRDDAHRANLPIAVSRIRLKPLGSSIIRKWPTPGMIITSTS